MTPPAPVEWDVGTHGTFEQAPVPVQPGDEAVWVGADSDAGLRTRAMALTVIEGGVLRALPDSDLVDGHSVTVEGLDTEPLRFRAPAPILPAWRMHTTWVRSSDSTFVSIDGPTTMGLVLSYRLTEMDYARLIKRLVLPPGYSPPRELTHQDICARAISRADLQDDVRGINSSLDLIRQTRGGAWPSGPVSEEYNYVDLVWHEAEFRDGHSFTYAVYDANGRYLGCCYLYPMGARTCLNEELLTHDVDVSWWVTPDAYKRGYYAKLHAALQRWLADSFPFENPHYSNREIPNQ